MKCLRIVELNVKMNFEDTYLQSAIVGVVRSSENVRRSMGCVHFGRSPTVNFWMNFRMNYPHRVMGVGVDIGQERRKIP
jgi:hypothetical protein